LLDYLLSQSPYPESSKFVKPIESGYTAPEDVFYLPREYRIALTSGTPSNSLNFTTKRSHLKTHAHEKELKIQDNDLDANTYTPTRPTRLAKTVALAQMSSVVTEEKRPDIPYLENDENSDFNFPAT
jgi:hypothetical protein